MTMEIDCPKSDCKVVTTSDVIGAHVAMHENVTADNTDAVTKGRTLDIGPSERPAVQKKSQHQIWHSKALKMVNVDCGPLVGDNDGEIKAKRKRRAKKYNLPIDHTLVVWGVHPRFDSDGNRLSKGSERHNDWVARGGISTWLAKYGAPDAHTVPDAQLDVVADGMGAEGLPDGAFLAECDALAPFVAELTHSDFSGVLKIIEGNLSLIEKMGAAVTDLQDQNQRLNALAENLRGDLDALECLVTGESDAGGVNEHSTLDSESPEPEVTADDVPESVARLNAVSGGRKPRKSAVQDAVAEYVHTAE